MPANTATIEVNEDFTEAVFGSRGRARMGFLRPGLSDAIGTGMQEQPCVLYSTGGRECDSATNDIVGFTEYLLARRNHGQRRCRRSFGRYLQPLASGILQCLHSRLRNIKTCVISCETRGWVRCHNLTHRKRLRLSTSIPKRLDDGIWYLAHLEVGILQPHGTLQLRIAAFLPRRATRLKP